MRIGIIAPPWLPVPPVGYGGTEAVIDRLARGFVRSGHEVLLAAATESTCAVPRAATTTRALGVGSGCSEDRYVIEAYDALQGCDVIHDHTLCGPQLAALTGDARVVTTNHGPFSGALLELYSEIADRVPIIAISHAQAAAAPALPIAGVIHHGLDVDAFPLERTKGKYFLFLGRMTPEKGAHRAARIARRAGVRLLLAAKMSEPHEHHYFETQVAPLLGRDIIYVGEVREREKLALLAGARGLLNPIRWDEPFGLVMIEALACGTPVFAFPCGAAPEIVDDGITGFLCADEEEMASGLERADEIDPDRCREAVCRRFSTDQMVRGHLEVFARITGPTSVAARHPRARRARTPTAVER